MHEHAGYVYISDDRTERWATFEDYQPFIALLFLAAKDEQVPATDNFSIDTRLEHFITELAFIGRAHNWDTTRFVTDAEGNLKQDQDGQPISEEYDDLEGDRPSCYSGVKRRLFQSLKGHPMFQSLDKAVLEQEVRSFVRQHFETSIPKNNPQQLQNAWNELIEGNQNAVTTLKVLDLSPDQQQGFVHYLNKKYGLQFTEEPEFIKQVENSFKFLKPENDCHVVYFSLNVGFQELLDKAVSEQVPFTANSCILFTPMASAYANNQHEHKVIGVKEEDDVKKSLKRPYSD
jgi:hypothetical protein